jgi:hypothetical protein
MRVSRSLAIGGLLLTASTGLAPALATDATDLDVGLKTLPLMSRRLDGPINMAIVFDPDNARSKDDAQAIKAAADMRAVGADGQGLVAMAVAANDLVSLKGAKVIFVAQGVGDAVFDLVAQVAASDGLLSISADLRCVMANKCILGIVSRPTVEVYFSRHAADAAHIGFSPAFIMLARPT